MLDWSKLSNGWYQIDDSRFKYVYVTLDEDKNSELHIECALDENGNVKILNKTCENTFHFTLSKESIGKINYLGNNLFPDVITKEMSATYCSPLDLCYNAILVLITRYAPRVGNTIIIHKESTLESVFQNGSIKGIILTLAVYFSFKTERLPKDFEHSLTIGELVSFIINEINL